jgi:hypothetical protein
MINENNTKSCHVVATKTAKFQPNGGWINKLDKLTRKLFSLKLTTSASEVVVASSRRTVTAARSVTAAVDTPRSVLIGAGRHVSMKDTSKFWYANRTQVSIKADRQITEYFYHCIRNIDYPMRINYCWNFSLKHENYFKKTLTNRAALRRVNNLTASKSLLLAAKKSPKIADDAVKSGKSNAPTVPSVCKKKKKKKRKTEKSKKKSPIVVRKKPVTKPPAVVTTSLVVKKKQKSTTPKGRGVLRDSLHEISRINKIAFFSSSHKSRTRRNAAEVEQALARALEVVSLAASALDRSSGSVKNQHPS